MLFQYDFYRWTIVKGGGCGVSGYPCVYEQGSCGVNKP